MIGKLAFVATAGTIGAAVFLALGIGLSGRDWTDARQLWNATQSTCGSTASIRQKIILPLAAGDGLTIDLPASVRYQPGDTAEAVVSGDPTLLDHVRLEGSRLSLDCDPGWFASGLDVSVSGPAITDWKLLGSGDLTSIADQSASTAAEHPRKRQRCRDWSRRYGRRGYFRFGSGAAQGSDRQVRTDPDPRQWRRANDRKGGCGYLDIRKWQCRTVR